MRVERIKSMNAHAAPRPAKARSGRWVLNIGAFDLNPRRDGLEFLNRTASTSVGQLGEHDGLVDFGLIETGLASCSSAAPTYRMKGVLNVRHATDKYVYHAVHMIYNGEFEPWLEDEDRDNNSIGKNLGQRSAALRSTRHAREPRAAEASLRFKVGTRVECNMGDDYGGRGHGHQVDVALGRDGPGLPVQGAARHRAVDLGAL